MHDAGHLRLQHVLRPLDLLVGEVAERRKVVAADRLGDADRRIAQPVSDGNVRLLVARVKDLFGGYSVHHSVQVTWFTNTIIMLTKKTQQLQPYVAGCWSVSS